MKWRERREMKQDKKYDSLEGTITLNRKAIHQLAIHYNLSSVKEYARFEFCHWLLGLEKD